MTVYFLRGTGTDYVKIGYTAGADPVRRLRALQTGAPFHLEVIRVVPGDRTTETWLHARFTFDHLLGDWFTFNPRMMTVDPPTHQMVVKQIKDRRGMRLPHDAHKLGFDPRTDTRFYGRIGADGLLTIYGKSLRDASTWVAADKIDLPARVREGFRAKQPFVSPFPLRQLG